MSLRIAAGMCATAMAVAGLVGVVRADITVEQQIDVDGFGPTKFGALEGKTTTAISGDHARTDRQSQFKSKLLRALARNSGTNTVRIVRLDAELIDEIDPVNKKYSEMTFQQLRDATAQAMANAQNAKPTQQPEAASGAPVDDSKCQWSPPKTELKQSGEHATIAGTDASRATITVTSTCTDPTKGTSCDFVFLLDEWMAADIPGTAETRAFWASYAKKMNFTGDQAQAMQSNAQAVFDRYKNGWGEALKRAGSLKGYPVKTIFAMQFGGPMCKDDSSGGASSGGSGNSGNSGNSGTGSSNGSDNGNNNSSSNESSVPTSPSAAVGSLAKGLFNRFHKSDDSQSQSAAAQPGAGQSAGAPPPAPGMVQLFQMSTETVAVRTDAIPSSAFEVPAGYTKVDKPVGTR